MTAQKITFKIPREVESILNTLTKAGFEAFLVGGCVRDLAIGRSPKDWDITTNAQPEKIISLFPKTFYENDFGTVCVVNEETEDPTLKNIEITPYRKESNYDDHRRPSKILWSKTINEDLARRDFTMNALAYNNTNNEITDLHSGLIDIKKKNIRTVGVAEDRFGEDALRMLRAVRFVAELGFSLDHDTQTAIERASGLLSHISKERIRDEFKKIVDSNSPALAIEILARLGLLKFITPELEKGIGIEQNEAHSYTVWEHLLRSLDYAAQKNFPLHVRLAALFHDIAKPHTRRWQKGQWTFYGHEVVGARITQKILSELKFPKDFTEKVVKLVRWHMFFSDTEEISLSAVRRIVRNVGPELIWDLMSVRVADRIGTGRPKENPYRLRKYKAMIEQVMRDPISVKQLAIGGEEVMKLLNIRSGPNIGFILEILLSEVLEDPILNTKGYLTNRVKELHTLPPEQISQLGNEARQSNQSEEDAVGEEILSKYKVS